MNGKLGQLMDLRHMSPKYHGSLGWMPSGILFKAAWIVAHSLIPSLHRPLAIRMVEPLHILLRKQ